MLLKYKMPDFDTLKYKFRIGLEKKENPGTISYRTSGN